MIYPAPNPLLVEVETDFELVIYDALGQSERGRFSRGRPGVKGGMTTVIDPLMGCKTMTFEGRPDLVPVPGGEICHFFTDDGSGLVAQFYGPVVEGFTSEPTDQTRSATCDATELLKGRPCDAKLYLNQDPATIAADLIKRLRHKAIKYSDASKNLYFPPTGTTMPSFIAAGVSLYDALAALADAAAKAGVIVGYGTDVNGFAFFRPNTDVLTVPFRSGDFQTLPTQATGLLTSVKWVLGSQPAISPWSGTYRPSILTYDSIPESQLEASYGYMRGVPAPDGAYEAIDTPEYVQSGFTDPANAVDNSETTYASRSGTTGTPYFALTNADGLVCGATLRYRMDYATPAGAKFRGTALMSDGTTVLYEIALPYSDGAFKRLPIPLPPARETTGTFMAWSRLEVMVPTSGVFYLADLRPLRVDIDRLDGMAAKLINTPARLPSQLQPKRDTPQVPRGYNLPAFPAFVQLTGSPYGEPVVKVAEYRVTWNETDLVQPFIDLGSPSRSGDAALVEMIRMSLDRDLGRAELQSALTRIL